MEKLPIETKHIYQFDCDEDIINDILSDIKNNKVIFDRIDLYDQEFGYDVDGKMYYNQKLFDFVGEKLALVSDEIFLGKKLKIVDCWMTKHTFGKSHGPHVHLKSILSGILYLTNSPGTYTYFLPDNPIRQRYKWIFFNEKDIAEKEIKFNSPKGKLLIFPSDLYHGISTHKSMDTRYSFSFNTFFTGLISDITTARLTI